MAKKPLPAKRPAASPAPPKPAAPKGGPPPVNPEAVGRFDKFATFALAVPTFILAVLALVLAASYTRSTFDIGIPGKTVEDYNNGPEAIQTAGEPVQVIGFERHNYIGRASDGDVDVAVLNVGSNHNVKLGDVFTLPGGQEGVRLEFVVYELGASRSRAYILLGETPSDRGARRFGLQRAKMVELCGGERNITVQRQWRDQIVRRGVERRELQ
jgi:hypothetical protein